MAAKPLHTALNLALQGGVNALPGYITACYRRAPFNLLRTSQSLYRTAVSQDHAVVENGSSAQMGTYITQCMPGVHNMHAELMQGRHMKCKAPARTSL